MKKKNGTAIRDSVGDKIFRFFIILLLGLLLLIVIYPLYFIVIASISDPDAVLGGKVVLFPVNITFSGFAKILERSDVWKGYLNTIIYTAITVVLSLAVTIPAGWALSRKKLPFRRFWMIYFIINYRNFHSFFFNINFHYIKLFVFVIYFIIFPQNIFAFS